MSRLEQRLIDGHLAAKQQRERLKSRLAATRDRLAPQRLLADARTEAERQIRTTASNVVTEINGHPVRTALLGGAVLAWVFRHPLIDHGPGWIKRAYAVVSGRQSMMDDGVDAVDDIADVEQPVDQWDGDTEHWPDNIVQQNDSH